MKTSTVIFLIWSLPVSLPVFAITGADSLAAWELASQEDRITVVRTIAKDLAKPGNIEPRRSDLRFLINCLDDLASIGEKNSPISAALKACWSTGNLDKRLTPDEIRKEQEGNEAVRKAFRDLKRPSTEPQSQPDTSR